MQQAISFVENKFIPPDGRQRLQGTHVKYDNEALKKLVAGQTLTFLVDSGATHSVIRTSDLQPSPKLSGNYVYSVGAAGIAVKERLTVPLRCEDVGHSVVKHAFLLSSLCPVNILGHDLMCSLGTCLLFTPERSRWSE